MVVIAPRLSTIRNANRDYVHLGNCINEPIELARSRTRDVFSRGEWHIP